MQEFHVHPCSSPAKCLGTKGLASPPSLVILLPILRSVGGEAHATLYSIRTVICSVVVSSSRAFSERIPKRKRCFVGGLSRRSRRPLRAPAPPETSSSSQAQSQLRLLPARIATLAGIATALEGLGRATRPAFPSPYYGMRSCAALCSVPTPITPAAPTLIAGGRRKPFCPV